MILQTNEIIKSLHTKTDEVILFSSAIGKDSIVLLDLLIKNKFKVHPVFMYIVENLSFCEKYIEYQEKKYNVEFLRVSHFCVASHIKFGYLGHKKNDKNRLENLSITTENAKKQIGIDWCVFGFKKTDGLNRRIFLNEFGKITINEKTKKCYPIADWTNKDCYSYIKTHKLINPLRFNNKQSTDIELEDKDFLFWIEKKYPEDLKKIICEYPEIEYILNIYHNENI